jgi:hypothetical protein
MREPISLERYNELVAFLIQSGDAMDETVRALSSDPLQAPRVKLLKESLALARALLTEVFYSQPYLLRLNIP